MKIQSGQAPPTSTLCVGDDPEGWATRVKAEWIPTCNIALKKCGLDGQFCNATSLLFEVSDLIEAELFVDVVVRRRKNNRPKLVDTRFCLIAATKLLSRSNARVSC